MSLFPHVLRSVPVTRLGIGLVLVLAFSRYASGQNLTDRQVFQESFAEAKTADSEYQSYIFREIALAETARGYYDYASEAAGLDQKYWDLTFTDMVSARLKRGDLSGAKQLAGAAENPRVHGMAESPLRCGK